MGNWLTEYTVKPHILTKIVHFYSKYDYFTLLVKGLYSRPCFEVHAL